MMGLIQKFNQFSNKIAKLLGERVDFGVPPDIDQNEMNADYQYESVSNILNYETYDEDQEIFHNKSSFGFVLEATPLLGADEQTSNVLARIISEMLPQEVDLQLMLWGSDKIGNYLDRFLESRKKHTTFSQLAEKRIQFLKKGVKNSLAKDSSFLLRDFQLIISVSMNKDSEENIKTLVFLRENMMSALKSINIHTRKIAINDFISLISDLLHPHQNIYPAKKTWNKLDSLSAQIVESDGCIRTYPNYLVFERENASYLATSYNVLKYPDEFMLYQMGDAIGSFDNRYNQIPCPFILSFSLRVIKNGNSDLSTTFKAIDSEKTANSKQRLFSTHLVQKAHEMKFIQARLADGDRLVKTYFQITLIAESQKMVDCENKLLSLFQLLKFKIKKIRYLQLQSFLALLPMRMNEIWDDLNFFSRFYTMTSFNAANLMPVISEWQGTKTPHLLLVGKRGQLLAFSPFDNLVGNFNMLVTAPSGGGKSFLSQEYLKALLGSGGRIWVIDIGYSFERTCQYAGGTFIDFSFEEPICINPFTHVIDFKDSLELLNPMFTAMVRPNSKISDEERVYLGQALERTWEKLGNAASVKDVAEWLNNHSSPIANNLGFLLYPFTHGAYKPFFVGAANIDLSDSLVVLELEKIKGDQILMRIALIVLSFQVSQAMLFGDKRQNKTLIIDEFWQHIAKPDPGDFGSYVGELARTMRKKQASLIVIIQSVKDITLKPAAKAIHDNSDFRVILPHKEETINELLMEKFISESEAALYKNISNTSEYSELIIGGPGGKIIGRLIIDPFSRILYTTKGSEFQAVKDYQARGLSLFEAVSKVTEEVWGQQG